MNFNLVVPVRQSWHCIGCGKVHAPHLDTCPEFVQQPVPYVPYIPPTSPEPCYPDPLPWDPNIIYCGEPS